MIPQISPATAPAAAPTPPPGSDGSGQAFADLLDEPVEEPQSSQPASSDMPVDQAAQPPAGAVPSPAAGSPSPSQAPVPPDQPDAVPAAPTSDVTDPFGDDTRESPAIQPDQSLAERLFAAMELPKAHPEVAGAAGAVQSADASGDSGDLAPLRTVPAPQARFASLVTPGVLSLPANLEVVGVPSTGQLTTPQHPLAQPSPAQAALPLVADDASAHTQSAPASNAAAGSTLATNPAQGAAAVMVRQSFATLAPASAEAAVLLRANYWTSGLAPPPAAPAPESPEVVPATPQIARAMPPLPQDAPAVASDLGTDRALAEMPFAASPMIDTPRGTHSAIPAAPAPLPPPTIPALVQAVNQAGPGTVELVLTPEDLGKLRFEVTQNGDQMRIHLTVERPDTLDLLRRNAEQLLAEFRQAGYAGATLSFAQSGQGGQQDTPSPHPPPQAAPAAQPDSPSPQTPPPYQNGTGLDLRL